MRGGLIFLSTLILSLAAGLGGYSLFHHWSGDAAGSRPALARPGPASAAIVGQRRPDFALADIEGRQRSISEWDGKVLLVNFWATWCPPCRREIPTLVDVAREFEAQGLVVLGIAIDDASKVARFVEQFGVSYPSLVGQSDASRVAADLGNRSGSLPFSAVIDRDGTITYLHLGEISRETILSEVNPLLNAAG